MKWLFVSVLLFPIVLLAQTRADSLKSVLKTQKNDTNKVNSLSELGWELVFSDPDTGIILGKQAIALAIKLKWDFGTAANYNLTGTAYAVKADYEKALTYFLKCLAITKKTGDKKAQSNSYGNIGNIYFNQGNLPAALDAYYNSLKIAEKLNDPPAIAIAHFNIASVYGMQKNYDKALESYFKCLKLDKNPDESQLGRTYGNIGNTYTSLKKHEEALKYYLMAFSISEKIMDTYSSGVTSLNVGNLYVFLNNYPEAKNYYTKSISYANEIGNKQQAGVAYSSLGNLAILKNDFKEAEINLNKAVSIAKEIGDLYYHKEAESFFYKLYKKTNKHEKALKHYKAYIMLRDSIFSEENHSKLIRTELNHEFEKKAIADSIANAKQQEIKNAEIAKHEVEINAKRKQQYYLYAGLLMVMLFAVFIYNRFKVASRQKMEILEQKLLVEEKQKEILDSIYYARRIQRALLPSGKYIEKSLNKTKK